MNQEVLEKITDRELFANLLLIMSVVMFLCAAYLFYRKNTLLGLEYLVLSVGPFLGYLWAQNLFEPLIYDAWKFTDYFSRFLGSTIFICLGIMKVTHNMKLSRMTDVLLIHGGLLLTYCMLQVPLLKSIFPFLYIVSGLCLVVLLVVLAYQLFQYQQTFYGCLAVLSIILLSFIGLIEDFVAYPVTPFTLLNRPYVELVSITISFILIMFAYRALEKEKANNAEFEADYS